MKIKILDSLELFPANELEVQICLLPSGEKIVRFEDCTDKPPVIYGWCLEMANEWLKGKL